MNTNEFFPVAVTKHGKPGFRTWDGRILPIVSGGDGPEDAPAAEEKAPTPPQSDVLQIQLDPPEAPPAPNEPERLFTREDIEKARSQEKDKLYNRIASMEDEVTRFRAEREERERQEAERQAIIEEETRRMREEEMSVRELLQAKEQEWNDRFAEVERERSEERALFEKERQFQALMNYRQSRLESEADEIMPELLDLISGNSEEEIEQSIALAKDKTARILQSVQQATASVPAPRGASVTAPPVGPMENDSSYKTMTSDDIRDMDMNTYAQNRAKIMAALNQKVANGGVYG